MSLLSPKLCYNKPMNKKDNIKGMVALLLLAVSVLLFHAKIQNHEHNIFANSGLKEPSNQDNLYAGVSSRLFQYDRMIASGEILAFAPELTEDDIYSFLQGPKAWADGTTWSGEWCMEYAKGQYFGEFGCGFCCMANLYGTFSGHECSPLDVFEYAKEVTGYAPTKASAAIDWGNMKILLQKMGFQCDVYGKPDTYEEFQEQIKNCKSAVVLICSANDDTFWENNPGHYVTVSLYDEITDEVFLTESGSPDKNRTRIPLRYIYDALKTTSKFQYLMVDDYTEENNQWKHDGIDDKWIAP